MNEYVLVEFISIYEEKPELVRRLALLEKEFELLKCDYEFESECDDVPSTWCRVNGKISSQLASLIKLQDPFLADRMRISYIPSEAKDKYRR